MPKLCDNCTHLYCCSLTQIATDQCPVIKDFGVPATETLDENEAKQSEDYRPCWDSLCGLVV